MSTDRRLLTCAEVGAILGRLYTWSEPWVTLGCFQDPRKDLVPECAVPWIMRPTGGRGVLHGHDVTLGFAAPLSIFDKSGGGRRLRAIYRAIAQPLIEGLQAGGVNAVLGEDTLFASRLGTGADCFAHVSANDIVEPKTGAKVCGCALKVSSAAVLLQASIPVGSPLVDPRAVFPDGQTLCGSPLRVEEFAMAFENAVRTWRENNVERIS